MNIRILAIAALAALPLALMAQGPKATAEEMIASIKAVKMPVVDRTKVEDKSYVAEFMKAQRAALSERGKLILAFYKEYPTHEEAPALMQQRWSSMVQSKEDVPIVLAELDEVIKSSSNEKVVQNAHFYRANYTMMDSADDEKKSLAAVLAYTVKYPTDERGASLLAQAADRIEDKTHKLEVYDKILKEYPNARGAKYVPGKIKQTKGLGQPFELSFTDAVSGKKTSMADFKGKVVVIDFWATWCGPCIADLPKVQKMYSELKDQGVEIVSVSLDQPEEKGGLKSLRDFVAKNPMPWAHYYQGNFWDSEFSTSWGINAIPSVFLVDQNGVLVDVEARGDLENKVKALLAKAK